MHVEKRRGAVRLSHRPNTIGLLFAGILLPVILAQPAGAAFLPLEEIPTEGSLYLALEDLATRYGVPAGFPHTRPWTLGSATEFLEALQNSGCGCDDDPAFIRLQREVEPEGSGAIPFIRQGAEGSSVELSPYVRLRHREDRVQDPAIIRDHRIGASAAVEAGGGKLLAYADYYVATFSPEPHGNPISGTRHAVVEGSQVNLWFDRAFVAGTVGGFSTRIGHTWLRWGPGRTGTLGLFDGSLALDVAEFRWQILPPAQLTWFVAALDAFEEEYLAGHRIEARVGSSAVLGLAELGRFSGTSQAALYLLPVVGFSQREKQVSRFSDTSADSQGVRSRNNVLWTADLEWRVLPGVSVYGEFLVDDFSLSSDYRPTKTGYQVGTRWSRRQGARNAVAARIEHTRITNYAYSSEHGHDFASDGYPLAYPFGPDVEVLFGGLNLTHGPDWVFGLELSRFRKGEGAMGEPWDPAMGRVDNFPLSGVVERRIRLAANASFSPSRRIQTQAEVAWTTAENFQHTPGRTHDRWSGSTAMVLRW